MTATRPRAGKAQMAGSAPMAREKLGGLSLKNEGRTMTAIHRAK